jgi:cell wall-associated NlpC family hydrolase
MALSFSLYGDLLGKPWREDARGPDAYDCLGLAIEVQRRRGLAVPDFISSEAELHRQMAAGGFLAGCTKLEAAEAGAVALLKTGVNRHHLGIMLDRYRILHTAEGTKGVVVERILGPLWERRVFGFYLLETDVPA